MPEVEKDTVVKEALEAARAIDDVWVRDGKKADRASDLTKVVWHLPKTARKAVVREALAAAVAIGDQVDYVEALIALVKYLPEAEKASVVNEALVVAKGVGTPVFAQIGEGAMPILLRWESRRRRATEHGARVNFGSPARPEAPTTSAGPRYRQRPEERFNFSGFTGALER